MLYQLPVIYKSVNDTVDKIPIDNKETLRIVSIIVEFNNKKFVIFPIIDVGLLNIPDNREIIG